MSDSDNEDDTSPMDIVKHDNAEQEQREILLDPLSAIGWFDKFLLGIAGNETSVNRLKEHFPVLVETMLNRWTSTCWRDMTSIHSVIAEVLTHVGDADQFWYEDLHPLEAINSIREQSQAMSHHDADASMVLRLFLPRLGRTTPTARVTPIAITDASMPENWSHVIAGSMILNLILVDSHGNHTGDHENLYAWFRGMVYYTDSRTMFKICHELIRAFNNSDQPEAATDFIGPIIVELPDSFSKVVLSHDDLKVETLEAIDSVAQAKLIRINEEFPEPEQAASVGFDELLSKESLYDYQKEVVKWMYARENGIDQGSNNYTFKGGMVACLPGMGKTRMALTLATLGGGMTLVLVPLGVISEWANEIHKAFNGRIKYKIWHHSESTRREMEYGIINMLTWRRQGVGIVITTPHTFVKGADSYRRLSEEDQTFAFDRMILDESHIWANAGAGTYVKLKEVLARIPYKWCLTGTPYKNRIKDLINQLVLAGGDLDMLQMQHKEELKTHMKMLVYGPDTITLVSHTERELRVDMDAVDLELYQYIFDTVKKETTRKYSSIKLDGGYMIYMRMAAISMNLIPDIVLDKLDAERIAEFQKKSSAWSAFASALVRTGQSAFGLDPLTYIKSDKYISAKMRSALDLIIERIDAGKKVIVFSFFVDALDLLKKLLHDKAGRGGVMEVYTGKTTPAERKQIRHRFGSKDGTTKVMGITYLAGGQGLNLQVADCIIELDPCLTYAQQVQAEARVVRVGQSKIVEIIRLLTGKTFEINVSTYVKQKRIAWEKFISTGDATTLGDQDVDDQDEEANERARNDSDALVETTGHVSEVLSKIIFDEPDNQEKTLGFWVDG